MPVLPGENTAFGQAAKENQKEKENSNEKPQAGGGASNTNSDASVNAHKANLGPVIAQDLGEPASKEEIQKRMAELNKDE